MAKRQSVHIEGLEHGVPIPNATRVGNVLMSSFIGGKDPETGKTSEDLEVQIRTLFANIERILAAAGGTLEDLVKIEFTAKDRSCRTVLDPIWTSLFPDENSRPARHVIAGELAGTMQIQAEIFAVIDD